MASPRKIRIGINGFGRIGRTVFKQLLHKEAFEVVGINDLASREDLAYLLKYDSVHGWNPAKISSDDSIIRVGGKDFPFFSQPDPAALPWGDLDTDIVIESSGALRSRAKASGHLIAGARRVIVSAPADDLDAMIVMGVNEESYRPAEHRLISMASCTTNCLAPVAKVLHQSFGIASLVFTTVHAYTSSQSLMDIPARHRRRGRAAALSIIPTTTGAAGAAERVLPELAGRITGLAMRVPVPDGSITDMVITLERDSTTEQIHQALLQAAEKPPLQGILRVTEEALVSQDILGDPHSAIVDASSTMMLGRRIAKVLAWYDNEWGFSARLIDLARHMTEPDI
jgi:glyceraldehyde 3-phosphate dehydrogenase